MLQLFGYAAGVLSVICLAPYLRDMFRGTTKPQRATWLIWTVLGSIAFFSQLAKGATDSLWMTGVQTVVVTLVFFLSIKYGVGGLARRDVIALMVAVLGLVLWYLTKEAAIALFIVIFIDAVALSLTVIKAYKDPSTETTSALFLAAISGVFAILAVGSWNWILLAYPLYIVLGNAVVLSAMTLGGKFAEEYR